MSLMTRREVDGLQLQLVGARELEEAVQHLVETLDLAGDDLDVLVDVRGVGGRRIAVGVARRRPVVVASLLFNSSR